MSVLEVLTLTGHVASSLMRVFLGGRGGITAPNLHRIHHAPPYIKPFFFFFSFCWLAAQSELLSGGCEGSKKLALSHWIMTLFQLLWPGMPNFTARYSSLCVNQRVARGRGAHRSRLPHRAIWSDHWSLTHHITHAPPAGSTPDLCLTSTTISYFSSMTFIFICVKFAYNAPSYPYRSESRANSASIFICLWKVTLLNRSLLKAWSAVPAWVRR